MIAFSWTRMGSFLVAARDPPSRNNRKGKERPPWKKKKKRGMFAGATDFSVTAADTRRGRETKRGSEPPSRPSHYRRYAWLLRCNQPLDRCCFIPTLSIAFSTLSRRSISSIKILNFNCCINEKECLEIRLFWRKNLGAALT